MGHTSSHRCVRLTNWDAETVAGLVRKGTVVMFEPSEQRTSPSRLFGLWILASFLAGTLAGMVLMAGFRDTSPLSRDAPPVTVVESARPAESARPFEGWRPPPSSLC